MKRILVVEDDKDIIELVRYNLEKDGYQVGATGDGATGLAQLRKTPPDLLILDLMLPKLSGLEICKEVRKDVSLNRLADPDFDGQGRRGGPRRGFGIRRRRLRYETVQPARARCACEGASSPRRSGNAV